MGDGVEVACQVRIIHRMASFPDALLDAFQGVMGTPAGSKPVGAVHEIGFEDRLYNELHDGLHYAVYYEPLRLPRSSPHAY